MGSELKQGEAGSKGRDGSGDAQRSRRGGGLAAQVLGVVGVIVVAWLKYGRHDPLKECMKEHFSGIVLEGGGANGSTGVSEVSLSGRDVVNQTTDNNGHFEFAACPDSLTPHRIVVRAKKSGYQETPFTVGSTQSATLVLERKVK